MVEKRNKILTNGIGENGVFFKSHPLLNFVYFAVIIGVTMFSNHPVILITSFITGWFYSVLLNGKKAMRFNITLLLPVILITVLINALNVHNGVTVLFYLNDNRITLEAIIFGVVQGIMLSSVMIWFTCFNTVVTEDKFIYLFGRIAPVIALTLSMIIRFIPLLKNRFLEVSAAQRCMGRRKDGRNITYRIRQFGKEVSILIAWSLEASIESADSMEARGYGLHGRTSFHLFKITGKEFRILLLMLFLSVICVIACVMDYTNIYYYPAILLPPISFMQSVSFAAFCILMLLAVIMDIRGIRQ